MPSQRFRFLKKLLYCTLISLVSAVSIAAPVETITIRGTSRYSRSTLLAYAAIAEGDEISESDVPQIIHNLYLTDFFDEIEVDYSEEQRSLLIAVKEKSVLGEIEFHGYSHFSKTDLTKALVEYKLEVGRPFNDRALENMIREIQKMYYLDGYYEAHLPFSIDTREDGTLSVSIQVQEGTTAKVSAINIHGNYAFPSYTLRSALSLQATNALTFVTSADKYSEYKIEQDTIALENFYHDHGYPDMRVVDKRIRLTETRRGIIIDIFIEEGDKQIITEIAIDAPIELELRSYDRPDTPLSWNQKVIDDYEAKIRDSLNLAGYVYGEIRQERFPISSAACKLVYHVYPGIQYRIRDYNIQGNILTNERVVRNFITRPEGTYYSAADLRSFQEGLMRSSIFNDVQINPHAVSSHEVDLHINLEEAKTKKVFATGAVSNLGYMWTVGFEDRNILGTGTKTVVKYESDREANVFQLALSNPYITTKNIEAYLNFERVQKSYQNDYMFFKQDRNIYSTTLGSTWLVKQDLRFGMSSNYFIEKDKNVKELVDNPGEQPWAHYLFGSVKLFRNMFNRYTLPDRGYRWELFSQASLPVGDYTYTDSGLSYQHYHPFGKTGFIFYQNLSARFMFPYGDSSKSVIPSTRLLTCGGSDDIRGYHYTSVGPEIQSLQSDGTYTYKTVGGNIKSTLKTELILPNSMFQIDYDQIRLSLFIDVAQLWRTVPVPDSYNENGNTYMSAEGVRATGGICLRFVSPILPPMIMSLNYPLIQKVRDKIKYEYYSFGSQMEF